MKEVKTAKGKTLNILPLIKKNEQAIAVGNLNVNARGDLLGQGGKIVMTYKQRESEQPVTKVEQEMVGLAQIEEEQTSEYPKLLKTFTRKNKTYEEWEYEDGTIEEKEVK